MRKTEEAARPPQALASRYELTRVDGGGVLLDSETGQIMSLNVTAAEIWSRSLAGETPDDIAAGLARTYQVDPNSVRDDVARTLVVPPHVAPEKIDDFRYEVTPGGKYLAATDEGPVLELAAAGDRVDVLRPTSPSTLESYLCSVAPKLLALSGEVVLHASSVRYGSEAIAFLGASGAGKTTTAHAFAAAGDAKVVAEDMLLVRMVNGNWSALNAELGVRAWAARAVSHGPRDAIPFEPWRADQDLDSAALVAFHFVDRIRRRGTTVDPSPLSVAETAARLFGNSFLSSLAPQARSRHLAQLLSTARAIPGYELTLPNGLGPLKEATSQHLRVWRPGNKGAPA